jgi:hypothetical protein
VAARYELRGDIHGRLWWWCGLSVRAASLEVLMLGTGARELGVGVGELRLDVGAHEQGGTNQCERAGSIVFGERCHILGEYSPTTLQHEPPSKHPKSGWSRLVLTY